MFRLAAGLVRWGATPVIRLTLALAIGLSLCAAATAKEADSPIKRDEEVLFYPTFARQDDDGRSWQAAIHGSIFEPEEKSLKRALLVALLREVIPRKLSAEEERIFNRRVRLFLVDSERGKAISIRLGSTVYHVGTSGTDGHCRCAQCRPSLAPMKPRMMARP